MPISAEELTDTPSYDEPEAEPEGNDLGVRIVEWVEEIPRNRRTGPFDSIIDEVRRLADTARSAKIQWGRKAITPNKVNQLRKRFPDCEFTQVSTPEGRDTYVRFKGKQEETDAS